MIHLSKWPAGMAPRSHGIELLDLKEIKYINAVTGTAMGIPVLTDWARARTVPTKFKMQSQLLPDSWCYADCRAISGRCTVAAYILGRLLRVLERVLFWHIVFHRQDKHHYSQTKLMQWTPKVSAKTRKL